MPTSLRLQKRQEITWGHQTRESQAEESSVWRARALDAVCWCLLHMRHRRGEWRRWQQDACVRLLRLEVLSFSLLGPERGAWRRVALRRVPREPWISSFIAQLEWPSSKEEEKEASKEGSPRLTKAKEEEELQEQEEPVLTEENQAARQWLRWTCWALGWWLWT